MHFEFQYPLFFILLLLIICIYLCPLSLRKLYFPHLHFFTHFRSWFHKERLLYSIIVALLVTALASPIAYEKKSPSNRKGRDLVVVIDSSGSMGDSGYDNEKKRERKFDVVREILADFIHSRHNDNIGVSVFGSFAFASAPLTYDSEGLIFLLQYLDVGIAGDNTAIGDGIAQGIRVLQAGDAKKKMMILLSDGFQNSGKFSPKEAVNLAKQEDIKIYTIGIGSDGEYDKKLLQHIANESHGKFFAASDAEALKNVYDEINELEPSKIRSEHYLNKTLLYSIPLFIAIMLLLYILIHKRVSLTNRNVV